MEQILSGLRAIADPSRLRLLALCAQGELTVGDLVGILGQSQPRVSRHLKLLCDGGVLERFREGAHVFYRLVPRGPSTELARGVLALLPDDDPELAHDRARLKELRQARAAAAEAYFRTNAPRWAELRSLHVDEAEVEAALRRAVAGRPFADLLDIGTGTGRIVEILAPSAERVIGVDNSREMLNVARANLESAGLGHCGVRLGDMYALPFGERSFDVVTIHQVLHFAEAPAKVIAEAARVLRPGGRLAIVDFAPHELESLRLEHNHRRLGFADSEIRQWCRDAGLDPQDENHLPGQPLTVTLWLARRPTLTGTPQSRPAPAAIGETS